MNFSSVQYNNSNSNSSSLSGGSNNSNSSHSLSLTAGSSSSSSKPMDVDGLTPRVLGTLRFHKLLQSSANAGMVTNEGDVKEMSALETGSELTKRVFQGIKDGSSAENQLSKIRKSLCTKLKVVSISDRCFEFAQEIFANFDTLLEHSPMNTRYNICLTREGDQKDSSNENSIQLPKKVLIDAARDFAFRYIKILNARILYLKGRKDPENIMNEELSKPFEPLAYVQPKKYLFYGLYSPGRRIRMIWVRANSLIAKEINSKVCRVVSLLLDLLEGKVSIQTKAMKIPSKPNNREEILQEVQLLSKIQNRAQKIGLSVIEFDEVFSNGNKFLTLMREYSGGDLFNFLPKLNPCQSLYLALNIWDNFAVKLYNSNIFPKDIKLENMVFDRLEGNHVIGLTLIDMGGTVFSDEEETFNDYWATLTFCCPELIDGMEKAKARRDAGTFAKLRSEHMLFMFFNALWLAITTSAPYPSHSKESGLHGYDRSQPLHLEYFHVRFGEAFGKCIAPFFARALSIDPEDRPSWEEAQDLFNKLRAIMPVVEKDSKMNEKPEGVK